ncbi:hypothetical protein PM082_016049 [Marasmius tenuissimus]|nr:hypothetical protein PM082_016049 [Marasmius tenuissimus]
MKSVTFLAVLSAVAGALAQNPTLNTPNNLVACQPVQLNWGGGKAGTDCVGKTASISGGGSNTAGTGAPPQSTGGSNTASTTSTSGGSGTTAGTTGTTASSAGSAENTSANNNNAASASSAQIGAAGIVGAAVLALLA